MATGKKKEREARTREFIQVQGLAWKHFEQTLPYECEQRREEFDIEQCVTAWLEYESVYVEYGEPLPTVPVLIVEEVVERRRKTARSTR